ncbi:MAG: U32 family peptidase [Succinivibrio sp.]
MRTVELLAPAKNLECAKAAIDSGADAVYIGGPSFGARVNAPNSLEDIRTLCQYAHLFSVKVHVTLNTILSDAELENARKLAFDLYEAGVDVLIIQDLGLINGPLPPLEIHASTQQDNSTPQKVAFLEKAGFSQVVLARELSLDEIRQIRENTSVKLEAFVHGALCVGVSGRCYLSSAITGRSANRGECAQLCRVPMSLYDDSGNCLARDRYLLSMKDLNQTDNLEKLIDAGISSFKIEGRLKDENYVRNVTAYYRKLIDSIIQRRTDLKRSSYGTVRTTFEPDVNKSFNRGFTQYNTNEKKDNYANFSAPGFVGLEIGKLVKAKGHNLTFRLFKNVTLHNGDSLNYYDADGNLEGFRVSSVLGDDTVEIFQDLPAIRPNTVFYRNKDAQFEKQLAGRSSVRKLKLSLVYNETNGGIELTGKDETGVCALVCAKPDVLQTAKDVQRLKSTIEDKLGRLGDSVYELESLEINLNEGYFIPQSTLNTLRRDLVEKLNSIKIMKKVNVEHHFENAPMLPESERHLGFKANIYNRRAYDFYSEHGAEDIEYAYETQKKHAEECVLVSKHCLRYSFNLCPVRHRVKPETLYLEIGQSRFRLEFDCARCLMKLIGPVKA